MDIETLFKKFNVDIFRFFLSRLGNKEIAQDLTHDLFIKLIENLESFDESKGTIKTWMFTVARNLMIDFIRRNKKLNFVYFDLLEESTASNQNMEDRLYIESLFKAMDSLNEDDRELITLRYINDFEISEIAELVGKAHNTTKVSIFRAVQKLKKITENGGK